MSTKILKNIGNSLKEAENSITVHKHLQLEYDLGTLLAVDSNDLNLESLRKNRNEYLSKLSRDNVQLLLNEVWKLPTERVDECIVAKLPSPSFVLPRSRPLPKPKPLTRWEQFAKAKGIKKHAKTKQSWDEQLNKWIPTYGYKRAQAEKERDWVLEVPATSDPMEDQFLKRKTGKRESVAKNELQRLRNIAKSKNIKVPRLGLTNPEMSSAKELHTAVTLTRSATASLGKFQNKLPKEKDARGVTKILSDTKRKRKSVATTSREEQQSNLGIVDSVLRKRPNINVEKAVSRHLKTVSGNSEEEGGATTQKSKAKPKPGGGKRKQLSRKKSQSTGKRKGLKQRRR